MIAPSDLAFGVLLDYVGVAALALTGALAASRRRNTLLGFALLSVAAGLTGGTLRDLLIGAPVFWVRDAGYLAVCIATAGAAWAVGVRGWRPGGAVWLDAIGLCALAVSGAGKAAGNGVAPLSTVVVGVIAAVAGAMIRDLICREPLRVLSGGPYLGAAATGAGVYVVLRVFSAPDSWSTALALAGALAFCLYRTKRRTEAGEGPTGPFGP